MGIPGCATREGRLPTVSSTASVRGSPYGNKKVHCQSEPIFVKPSIFTSLRAIVFKFFGWVGYQVGYHFIVMRGRRVIGVHITF